ncbi:fasciclin domain-containing protein [Lysobacter sp. TAF61]
MSFRPLPIRLRVLAIALVLAVSTPAVFAAPAGGNGAAKSSAPAHAPVDIVDTAIGAGQFKTLAAALEAAGLVDTLKGAGPFTVFAPTDAAFAALPKGTVESLLKPENHDKLVAILTYHVVPGRVTASQVAGMDAATTVQGGELAIRASGGAVTVNGARVLSADVAASNGVIHVIDKVLIPQG